MFTVPRDGSGQPRRLVLGTMAFGLVAGMLPERASVLSVSPPSASAAHRAVERFVRAYLAAAPAEADAAAVGRLLGLSAAARRRLAAGLPLPPAEQARLQALRDQEFRRGEVVRLDGWLFARSEARLLVLTWLGAARTETAA